MLLIVDRAFSHYHHMVRTSEETLSFEDAIRAEPERLREELGLVTSDRRLKYQRRTFSYLARGRYLEQLERWWKVFPEDRFAIISSAELMTAPQKVLDDVGQFLGLTEQFTHFSGNRHLGGYQEPIKPATREQLQKTFRPHNQALYARLKRVFPWQ